MRRDSRVLLMAVVESADAIAEAVEGVSFDNKLTHEYDRIDDAIVWGVIQSYLQPLRSACLALAADADPESR